MAERIGIDTQNSSVPVVLIVDDDVDTCDILYDLLGAHGYQCHVAHDGETALSLAGTHPLDVVVLDIILPDCSGLEVLAELKTLRPEMEVVMLTVMDEADSAKEAMRDGAFDYLVKVSSIQQILAVVNEAWASRQANAQVCLEDLNIDLRAEVVTVAGKPTELTPTEWAVLTCLIRQRGEIVQYTDLWQAVWSENTPPDINLIQRTVSNLRQKVGESCIENVWGRGYRLG